MTATIREATSKVVISHAGSHSCLGSIMQKMQDNGIPYEEAVRVKWILFIIDFADPSLTQVEKTSYLLGQYQELIRHGIRAFRIITENGIALEKNEDL